MNDHNQTSPGVQLAFGFGIVMVLTGFVWLVALLADGDNPSTAVVSAQREPSPTVTPFTPAVTISPLPSPAGSTVSPIAPVETPAIGLRPVSRLMLESDLGTGSTEFSAVTLNESTNRLLIADDEGWLYEFDLTIDGEPVTPPRRTIRVAVGAGDIEGLAWMTGSIYVLAHENDGRLTIVDVPESAITIESADLLRTIDSGVREVDGNGLEGVAYLGGDGDIEFAVVQEWPPTIHVIDRSGNVAGSVLLNLGLPDVSDLWATADDSYLLLSDEGGVVVEVYIDASGQAHPVATLSLAVGDAGFEQPEGVVRSRDGRRLYVVGEAPGPSRLSFGMWETS